MSWSTRPSSLRTQSLRTRIRRVSRQLKFDKVYVEVYRNRLFATDEEIETVKKEFEAKGIIVSGGVTLAAGGEGGQFGTFDYENPPTARNARRPPNWPPSISTKLSSTTSFFYTSKSDADIAAKGARSWTQYRLDTMRDVARNLVLGPAKAVNPNVKMIVKYPNWYEHFQGLGYDLEKESQMFDYIYTGTETRDPLITDQLLQQYESYEIIRYFDNIRRTAAIAAAGWTPTACVMSTATPSSCGDTLFAKAPEITLFNWYDMVGPFPVEAGARAPWPSCPPASIGTPRREPIVRPGG